MSSKTWRQRWLEPLARLLSCDVAHRRRCAAGRKRIVLRLEELECRLTPSITLTSIGPNSITAGSPDATITLNGAGFANDSIAQFNGTNLTTTFVSANQLTAVIPAADLVTAGSDPVMVVPSKPGPFSGQQTFTVNPAATVQFTTGAETINQSTGTFSIPVTLSGVPGATISTFASGFNSPTGLTFDAAGNLYVTNYNSDNPGAGTVSKVTPAGVVSTFASGFSNPEGLTFDAVGNLYVGNANTNTVSKVTPSGVVSTFASGFNRPIGLAFDAAGNLYVANFNINTVDKVTPAGVVSAFASGFNFPEGLVFDAAGNLYVGNGDASVNTVSKVTPAGVVGTFASGLINPTGLAFDAAGNLYVGNFNADTIKEVTPAGVVSTFAYGVRLPNGLAFDAAGNLYVVGSLRSTVSKLSTAVTVPFTLGGTAVSGTDYSGVTASPLVFAPGQTTAYITGTLLSHPGPTKTITLTLGTPSSNAALGITANSITIVEPNPTPTLTSISPNSILVGSPDTTVTLTGTGFINSSTADFNGTAIATTFVSATQLTAVIPASDLTTTGGESITVVTAGPGGGTSAPQTFTVNAASTTTTAANASAAYNTVAQIVALSATITSPAGAVNEGTETFTLLNGATAIGTAVTVNVVSGAAQANYSLPAGLTAGPYAIQAVYNGDAKFSTSTDASRVLTVSAAPTTTVAVLKSDGSLWQDGPGVGLQLLSPAGTILSISSVTDKAGNADVYAVTADHHLWEHTPIGWTPLSAGSFLQLSAATNAAGNAVIFAVLTDNSLYENNPTFPGDHWQLLSQAGTILSISAVTDTAGNDDVYAVTADTHLWEHKPTGWTPLSSGSFQQVSAGLNAAGQAIVFGVLTDHSLWENNSAFAGNPWQLLSPAGTILSASAAGADDVFAVTSDHHLWEHSSTAWTPRSPGSFESLSGATNSAGQGEVFAVLTDTSFWEYDPAFPGWQLLVKSGAAFGAAARTR